MKKCILILIALFIAYLPVKGQKVTTLIENTRVAEKSDITNEHGVSMYIEYGDKNILFDIGATDNFIKNANKLDVDISAVDILIISHAHMDHGGALNYFLKENSKAKIYMHENTKNEYYYNDHYIGLDTKLFSEFEDRIVFIKEFTEVLPDVYLLTSFGDKYLKPQNNNLFMKDENGKNPDNMEHEIVLVLKPEDGLVVFSGCSHNGILNMTEAALKQFPDYSVKAVLGGFHLMNPATRSMAESEETVINIAETFLKLPVNKIYTGHCTGSEAYDVLDSVLKDKLEPFRTGSVFQL